MLVNLCCMKGIWYLLNRPCIYKYILFRFPWNSFGSRRIGNRMSKNVSLVYFIAAPRFSSLASRMDMRIVYICVGCVSFKLVHNLLDMAKITSHKLQLPVVYKGRRLSLCLGVCVRCLYHQLIWNVYMWACVYVLVFRFAAGRLY